MKELPKELTAELLSLVFGIKLDTVDITSAYANVEIGIVYTRQEENYKLQDVINTDTLTRLMKEWCWNKYYITVRSGYGEFGAWSNFAPRGDASFVSMDVPLTEFEAVLKATHWVATEKGLL